MQVSLSPHLESVVKNKVKSGLYNNASEVIRDALRIMLEQEEMRQAKLQALRAAVQIGDDQADRGEFSDRNVNEIIDDKRGKQRRG